MMRITKSFKYSHSSGKMQAVDATESGGVILIKKEKKYSELMKTKNASQVAAI